MNQREREIFLKGVEAGLYANDKIDNYLDPQLREKPVAEKKEDVEKPKKKFKKKKAYTYTAWTEKEVADLKAMYANTSNPELSKYFGRAVSAIQSKAYILKLGKKKQEENVDERFEGIADLGQEKE